MENDGTTDSPVKEKKKKRKLGNAGTAKEFSWHQDSDVSRCSFLVRVEPTFAS